MTVATVAVLAQGTISPLNRNVWLHIMVAELGERTGPPLSSVRRSLIDKHRRAALAAGDGERQQCRPEGIIEAPARTQHRSDERRTSRRRSTNKKKNKQFKDPTVKVADVSDPTTLQQVLNQCDAVLNTRTSRQKNQIQTLTMEDQLLETRLTASGQSRTTPRPTDPRANLVDVVVIDPRYQRSRRSEDHSSNSMLNAGVAPEEVQLNTQTYNVLVMSNSSAAPDKCHNAGTKIDLPMQVLSHKSSGAADKLLDGFEWMVQDYENQTVVQISNATKIELLIQVLSHKFSGSVPTMTDGLDWTTWDYFSQSGEQITDATKSGVVTIGKEEPQALKQPIRNAKRLMAWSNMSSYLGVTTGTDGCPRENTGIHGRRPARRVHRPRLMPSQVPRSTRFGPTILGRPRRATRRSPRQQSILGQEVLLLQEGRAPEGGVPEVDR